MKIYIIKLFKSKSGHITTGENAGWYKNILDAINSIMNNTLDLSDAGYYEVAAVIPVDEGLYGIAKREEEKWYKWNVISKKYEKCDRPEEFEHLAFSI